MISNAESYAMVHKSSKLFKVTSDVRQGCILSPILFTLVIHDVMRTSLAGRRGIQWSSFIHLEYLAYADDVCVLSSKTSSREDRCH